MVRPGENVIMESLWKIRKAILWMEEADGRT